MSETEVYYVVRFRIPGDIWRRMQFKDGDRTYSEAEANEMVHALKLNGYAATCSKYTVTTDYEEIIPA